MDALSAVTILTVDPQTLLYIFVFLFLVSVAIGLSVVLSKQSTLSTPQNIQRITGTQTTVFEQTLTPFYKAKRNLNAQSVTANQKVLVNFAPLTVNQPGYIGPTLNGVYKEQEGVAACLKAGARCFVLPIDYHENSGLPKPAFPDVGEPCLLYRDEGGTIRSLNAGSIQKVAETLSNLAFNNIVPLNSDPLLVILYFIRTPSQNTREYLRYCSSVAKQLNPLIPYMLGQAPEGVYNRQARQDEILYTPIQNLERKVILLSNIDTSIFRNPKSVGVQSVPIKEDLDFLVHMRLYKQSDEGLGATEKAGQNQFARGYLERFSYYTVIPENRVKDTVDINRIRWIVALPEKGAVPELKDVKYALEKLGVQSIAYNLFAFDSSHQDLLKLWEKSGWIPKPEPVRFTIPEPYKPKEPSPKVNANQGQISSPTV
jgi:hypothetical protein